MFDVGSLTHADIEALIDKDPPRRHSPEESWESIVQAAVSQPLPLPSLSDAMTRTYIVSDFGSGEQWPDSVSMLQGDLKAHPRIYNSPFTALLESYHILGGEDVLGTAKIMQRCLRLNPKDRTTVQELLQDDWWQGAA